MTLPKIAIDCRTLQESSSRQRGIGRVIQHLIPEFAKEWPNLCLYGAEEEGDLPQIEAPVIIKPKTMAIDDFLIRNQVQHFHFMDQHKVPNGFRFSHTVTVHDLFNGYRGQNEKADLKLQRQLVKTLKNAKKLFSVSEFTRNELIDTHGFSQDAVVVTYPGTNTHLNRYIPMDLPAPMPDPFILTVGNFESRKNLPNIIKAILKVNKNRKSPIHLLAVQATEHFVPYNLNRLRIFLNKQSPYFHFLSWVSDQELAALYQHAQLFCFVSKAEGFGLPILEAMKFRTPILTSSTTAMPEVGQNGVCYANPYNVDDIAEQIRLCLENPSYIEGLKSHHADILSQFTYAKMAKNMAEQFLILLR